MKILNWNLERGGRFAQRWDRQEAVIASINADVVVLTEPPPQVLKLKGDVVVAPPRRRGVNGPETWVAIFGRGMTAVNIDVPFERMAVAATTTVSGVDVIIYGSVLPWNTAPTQAPDHALAGESSQSMFERVLAEQEADVSGLQSAFPGALVIWAGDFNASFAFDRPSRRFKFRDFVGLFDQHGFRSLYHEQRGCQHGDEPEDTFYLYHHAERGFHIDFMFASSGFQPSTFDVSVGSHTDWARQSDHMPLICEIHDRQPTRPNHALQRTAPRVTVAAISYPGASRPSHLLS